MKRWNKEMDDHMHPPQGSRKPPEPIKRYCEWKETDSYDEYYWETSCDQAFVMTDGTPEDNDMKFCCYCGKLIKEIH